MENNWLKVLGIFIFVLFFPSISSAGKILPKSTFAEAAIPAPPLYLTNFDKPKIFGIQLGDFFDEKIIIKESSSDSVYFVNPPKKNPIFDEYLIRVNEYNLISGIRAENATYTFQECSVRIHYLHNNWFSKYSSEKTLYIPEYTDGMENFLDYEFTQVRKFDYSFGGSAGPFEFLLDFKIRLKCFRNGELFLEIMNFDEQISLEGFN